MNITAMGSDEWELVETVETGTQPPGEANALHVGDGEVVELTTKGLG